MREFLCMFIFVWATIVLSAALTIGFAYLAGVAGL